MLTPPLFIYGTLRDPDILAAVLGREVSLEALQPATAEGHKCVYYPGQVYPALLVVEGSVAPGALLHGLTEADLAVLDAYEGEEYRRGSIVVQTDAGSVTALAYLPTQDIAPGAPAWTLETWTSTHKPFVLTHETEVAKTARETLQG